MRLPPAGKILRAVGFDDGPLARRLGAPVPVVGAVCANTRFEGMVYGRVQRDGRDATRGLCRMLLGTKFHPQIHLVLLDGLAFGGFNVVDLPALAVRTGRPCVAVMRRPPDLTAIERALRRVPHTEARRALFARAGPVHSRPPFHFQVCGAGPDEIAEALARLTDRGHVPEALRLAHLIGAALVTGVSGRRA